MEIVKVGTANYSLFMDMVRRRMGRDIQEEYNSAEDLENPSLAVYAAQEQGKFVGWISLVYIPKIGKFDKGHIYVDELYVEPASRRSGIAKALMGKADEMRQEFHASGIRLYVNVCNPGARALYEACGYSCTGQADYMEK